MVNRNEIAEVLSFFHLIKYHLLYPALLINIEVENMLVENRF